MGRLNDKKNQHYVWQNYLRPWTDDGKLFCLRNGKIFRTNSKNIAVERYFYRTDALTKREIEFIEHLVIKRAHPVLQRLHRSWLVTFDMPFQMIERWKTKGGDPRKLEELEKFVKNNLHEEVHAQLERRAIVFLEFLLKKEIGFYLADGEEKREFLLFLSTQYGRTNKIRTSVLENAARGAQDKLGINLEKIWNPLVHIFATNIAFGLSSHNFKLIFLENQSDLPFITGDQPVLNIHATNIRSGEMVDKLELYYPLSPRLALLLTEERGESDGAVLTVERDTAKEYNWHVFKSAKSELYAHSRDALTSFMTQSRPSINPVTNMDAITN